MYCVLHRDVVVIVMYVWQDDVCQHLTLEGGPYKSRGKQQVQKLVWLRHVAMCFCVVLSVC